MKKIITVLLALTMVLSLAACGKGNDKEPSNNEGGGNNGSAQSGSDSEVDFGEYKAVFKSAELTQTSDGIDAIIINIDFTNNGSKKMSFGYAFNKTPKQAGEELSYAIIYTNEEQTKAVGDNEYYQIDPGTTSEIQLAFKLVNLTDDVVIDFTDTEFKQNATMKISLASLK